MTHPNAHNIHPLVETNWSKYRFESERLKSFEAWPSQFNNIEKLVSAGFFYTGDSDVVKCFMCNIELGKWVENDDPFCEHQRFSTNCKFLKNNFCDNVYVKTITANVHTSNFRTNDVCTTFTKKFPQIPSATIHLCYPQFINWDERLKSYKSWPKVLKQSKKDLADAGFFYIGKNDFTVCYCCGGLLKDWEPLDNALEQHAKWFPQCPYLLTIKGQDFVDEIKKLQLKK